MTLINQQLVWKKKILEVRLYIFDQNIHYAFQKLYHTAMQVFISNSALRIRALLQRNGKITSLTCFLYFFVHNNWIITTNGRSSCNYSEILVVNHLIWPLGRPDKRNCRNRFMLPLVSWSTKSSREWRSTRSQQLSSRWG